MHSKDYYIQIRQSFLPKKLRYILVLESPPIAGLYFYDKSGKTSEPLFMEIMKLLKTYPNDKEEGLSYFRDLGFYLVDATYTPVNLLKGKERDATILSDFRSLKEDLKSICDGKPVPVVLVKANICRLLETRLFKEGFNVMNNGVVVPFPSTGQQKRFHEAMNNLFKFHDNA